MTTFYRLKFKQAKREKEKRKKKFHCIITCHAIILINYCAKF